MNEDNTLTSLTGKSLKDIAAIIYKLSQDVERYKEREASRGFIGTFVGCPVHADLSTVDKGARANRLMQITQVIADRPRTMVRTEDEELKTLVNAVENRRTPGSVRLLILHIARKFL